MRTQRLLSYFFMGLSIVLAFLLLKNQLKGKHSDSFDSATVLKQITSIQELATIKYQYAGVVGYKDVMKVMNMNVPLTQKHFLLKYTGYLKAGVNFSRIKIHNEGKQLQVSMPRAEIFDVVIDEKNIRVYDESDNMLNPIKIGDYNKAMRREKKLIEQNAINQDILLEANRHAELLVKSMLESMGYKDIVFTLEIQMPKAN